MKLLTRQTAHIPRPVLLGCAIASEVSASLMLKVALECPVLNIAVVIGYGVSFALLGEVLRRGMPLGVAYGVWAAVGVAATALLSAAILGEALTSVMVLGLVLLVAGVLTVELASSRSEDEPGGRHRLEQSR